MSQVLYGFNSLDSPLSMGFGWFSTVESQLFQDLNEAPAVWNDASLPLPPALDSVGTRFDADFIEGDQVPGGAMLKKKCFFFFFFKLNK